MFQVSQIDSFLNSPAAHPDSMDLPELDGFLTGIACNPAQFDANEWMNFALGNASHTPYAVKSAIRKRYGAILEGLEYNNAFQPISPEFCEDASAIRAWCRGFYDAIELRPDRWTALSATYQGQRLLAPILACVHPNSGATPLAAPRKSYERRALDYGELETLIPALYRYIRVVTQN